MSLILPSFAASPPSNSFTIPLDGEVYEITYTYVPRRASWYLDVRSSDGAIVARHRRVSPDSTPLLGVPGGPRGTLYSQGPFDPYRREEPALVYFTRAEVLAALGGS